MKKRINIAIRGAVQGVGFRPFVYRLANELHINGYINNNSNGVHIDAEADETNINLFIQKLRNDKPALSYFVSFEYFYLDTAGYQTFEITESENSSDISAFILPDIKVCSDCLREMYDKNDRRYLYPFINCTNCGPRFSIIRALPYDRKHTSMDTFPMCPKCREEYENPSDRRYHAQPIACPECGPHITLLDKEGDIISSHYDAILVFAELIRNGKIIALKGIGGYQLIADADNIDTVRLLRERKRRVDKPFALMFPDLKSIKNICIVSQAEENLLCSVESPIVILKRNIDNFSSYKYSSPGNPYLGVMLPYTPLHSLIMNELKIPVVATSGNLSEEPMCINEEEALQRLSGIADYFLVHNRPVLRHVDDSIARVISNRVMVTRRARGYAPLPLELNGYEKSKKAEYSSILSVGAHLKNTVALKLDDNIFISQHIGDLETYESNKAFENIIGDFKILYNRQPELIVADYHSDYFSTKYALDQKINVKHVQHHIAHIAACRLDNGLNGPALGIAWDGTGLGLDGSIWGGEFFISDDETCYHAGSILQFPLPGADLAVREPRRSALGILYSIYNDYVFDKCRDIISRTFEVEEISILKTMLEKNVNCPQTSSIGRLFDAVSSITGLCRKLNYEGQAAMMLEFAADETETGKYPFTVSGQKFITFDWQPMIDYILTDLKDNIKVEIISAKFHNTLAEMILAAAKHFDRNKILLSGGCFQNAFLLTITINLLEEHGFKVYTHQRIPPNDGGISVGQIAAADYLVGTFKEEKM